MPSDSDRQNAAILRNVVIGWLCIVGMVGVAVIESARKLVQQTTHRIRND